MLRPWRNVLNVLSTIHTDRPRGKGGWGQINRQVSRGGQTTRHDISSASCNMSSQNSSPANPNKSSTPSEPSNFHSIIVASYPDILIVCNELDVGPSSFCLAMRRVTFMDHLLYCTSTLYSSRRHETISF